MLGFNKVCFFQTGQLARRYVEAMVDAFIRDTSAARLRRFSEQRWPVLTAALAESFELESLGGADFLKKKVRLARYARGGGEGFSC